jgi:hypothetical protein
MKPLSENQQKEILNYILENTPVWLFNQATKSFSVQTIYRRFQKELMCEYPQELGSNLWFSIEMCKLFKPYQVDECSLPDMRFKLNQLNNQHKMFSKYHPRKMELAKEHDAMVLVFNEMLRPQNDLIKLYKKIQKRKFHSTTISL